MCGNYKLTGRSCIEFVNLEIRSIKPPAFYVTSRAASMADQKLFRFSTILGACIDKSLL